MVTEYSSFDDELKKELKCKEAVIQMRSVWNSLTSEEKKSRIKEAIRKARNRTVG